MALIRKDVHPIGWNRQDSSEAECKYPSCIGAYRKGKSGMQSIGRKAA